MQAWESDSDREMAERMASESQRPAPTEPEVPWRIAGPSEVREIRRALDDGYGPEEAVGAAAVVSIAVFIGMLVGIVLGFVMGRASL